MSVEEPRSVNNHTAVLVPLETWEYHSPLLKYQGKRTDLGLLAEALIYFDCVYVDIPSERELEDVVRWFVAYDHIDTLIRLIQEGTLRFFYHAFVTAPVQSEGIFRLLYLQDTYQTERHSFFPKVVNRVNLDFLSSGQRTRLYNAIGDRYLESKAEAYTQPLENANSALRDPERCSFLLQVFLDDVYRRLRWGKPPKVAVTIEEVSDGTWRIQWNMDLSQVSHLAGGRLEARNDIPIFGEANSNKFLWTASQHSLDLYLGDVMSTLTGNKLLEAEQTEGKIEATMRLLKLQVPFPDVRAEVNRGIVQAPKVLEIRQHSQQFRTWLQEGAELERDMLHAYYHDVAQKVGFTHGAESVLKLFGPATGLAAAGTTLDPHLDAAVRLAVGASGSAVGFLALLAGRLNKEWRPLVFGDFVQREIEDR